MKRDSCLRAPVFAAALIVSWACRSTPTETVYTVQAAIKGVVTLSGEPVANVTVRLTVTQVLHNGTALPIEVTRVTAADGSFTALLQGGAPAFQSRLTVQVTPPSGSALQPTTLEAGTLSLTDAIPPATTIVLLAFQ